MQRIGLRAGPLLITTLLRTLRISSPPVASLATPMIVVFWHGDMLVPWYLHRAAASRVPAAALVSASRDGDVLAALLQSWGITVVRGSSSSGGSEALQTMTQLAQKGFTLLVTPDGPRGPAHEMKIGALVVAQRTGVPLMLCAPHCSGAWRLKSWDAFRVPKPFSTVAMQWRGPISIPPDCVGEPLDQLRSALQRDLQEMSADA